MAGMFSAVETVDVDATAASKEYSLGERGAPLKTCARFLVARSACRQRCLATTAMAVGVARQGSSLRSGHPPTGMARGVLQLDTKTDPDTWRRQARASVVVKNVRAAAIRVRLCALF